MTLTWLVDNLKILHVDAWEITTVIKQLAKIYGDIKVKRGKRCKCLGMDINYEKPGHVCISMRDVENIIEEFPEEIGNATAAMLAGYHLFQIRATDKSRQLLEEQAVQLHHCGTTITY